MARKSQALIAAESEIAALTTQVGILMSQVQALTSALEERNEEVKFLNDCVEQSESQLAQLIEAVESAPVQQRPTRKPAPSPAVVESTPAVQVDDFARAMYAKFKSLPQAERLAIINFARPSFGHIGVDNIVAVRQAWHESKQAVA